MVDNGTPPAMADKIVELGNPILRQPVDSESVQAALRGKTGTTVEDGLPGQDRC